MSDLMDLIKQGNIDAIKHIMKHMHKYKRELLKGCSGSLRQELNQELISALNFSFVTCENREYCGFIAFLKRSMKNAKIDFLRKVTIRNNVVNYFDDLSGIKKTTKLSDSFPLERLLNRVENKLNHEEKNVFNILVTDATFEDLKKENDKAKKVFPRGGTSMRVFNRHICKNTGFCFKKVSERIDGIMSAIREVSKETEFEFN